MFPKDYEAAQDRLQEDAKVFITGRVTLEEERDGKLIGSRVLPFDQVQRKLWIRFADMEAYRRGHSTLMEAVENHGGRDQVVIFVQNPRMQKVLPPGQGVRADEGLMLELVRRFGRENVILQ